MNFNVGDQVIFKDAAGNILSGDVLHVLPKSQALSVVVDPTGARSIHRVLWESVIYSKPMDCPPQPDKEDVCYHSWTLYTGLQETFEYCELCDLRKDQAQC